MLQSLDFTGVSGINIFKKHSKSGIINLSDLRRKTVARDTKDIQFRELKDTISQLNITIAAQTQLITSLQKSLDAANEREAEQAKQLAAFKEQIDYLTKKLFGTSSERRIDDIEGQLNLFNEAIISQISTSVKSGKSKIFLKIRLNAARCSACSSVRSIPW